MRGKGEGSIYKRASDGMWCASIELPDRGDGKRPRKVICRKRKPDVIAELDKLKGELAEHGDIISKRGMTTAAWLEYWLDHIAAKRDAPRTLANKTTHVNRWIIPALGSKPLASLTPAHIRHFQETVTKAVSSGYAGDVATTLSTALRDAVKDGDKIRRNPCDAVDKPEAEESQRRPLTLEETAKVLRYVLTRPVRQDWALWVTYILTGARRGEVIGLEADRVNGKIDFSWQLQRITDISKAPVRWEHRHVERTLYLTRPKSKAGRRDVPLVEPLRSVLEAHMDGRRPGLVFTNRDGSPVTPEQVDDRWQDILVRAGVDPEHVVLHSTRHTAVDLLDAAGVPQHIQKDIVGHADERQTEDYRRKRDLVRMTEAMESMSTLISGELTGSASD